MFFTDSSQSAHSSGCFTANSTVKTSNGELQRLSELKIGDKILSIDSSGNTIYSEVIMFLDRDTSQKREFVKITTSGNAKIMVTPAHLLMVWYPEIKQTKYVFADLIQEGDYVLVNINGNLEPQKVVHITAELSKGVFAPLTREGTIIVDSIAASCYALIDSQSVAHWSFMPMRLANTLQHMFSFSKLSSKLATSPSSTLERTVPMPENGIHWYARTLYAIKDYVLPSSWIYH